MNPYGYGAPTPYGAPAHAYGAPSPPYGAPPYGAPPAPYGAPPPPYGAPPSPYGAPPPPYGALPPAPYGAPPAAPYGAPPAPYGAHPAPYGAPAPAYGAPPTAPATAPQPSGAAPAAPSTTTAAGQQQQQQPYHQEGANPGSSTSHPQPAAAAPPGATAQPPPPSSTAQAGGYPAPSAPPAPQTATPDSGKVEHAGGSQHQRPASAYPTIGGSGATAAGYAVGGPTPAADALARPASAAPGPATTPYGGTSPPAQPYMAPTTYSPAPGHGGRRRRAVLVGCSYPGSSAALNGCLNDVQCIQFCLQKRFGFTDQQIVVLRDDPGRHHDFTSTKANICRALQWLMTDQRPGDSLFFHFSGHGSQQYDRNGDEEDGYDETICPSDFRHAGQIVDDELNRLLVRPLLPGVTLHAVIDACHSGTALDLTFRAKVDGSGRWYWKGRPRYDKMTAGGTAFQFGACKDSQVAQDTKRLSGYAYTGAATFCFIQAIEKYGADQTYGQILSHMSATLRATTGAPGLNLGSTGSLIAGFLLGSAAAAITSGGQTPVLSCDKQVDLYATRISL